jgi:DNA-binding transcriptional LysR family regulator
MDRWTEIELFVQVAEQGSLSRAAEALGLSNAAASRHLAALEAAPVGAPGAAQHAAAVPHRRGRRLLSPLQAAAAELRDAESAVNEAVLKPTGCCA